MSGQRAYRRFLPHFQNDHRTYFVTFCTRDRWRLPEVGREIVLRNVVSSAEYFLHTCVVMPDHVHVLLTPSWNRHGEVFGIADIVRLVKGRSARGVNVVLSRSGSLWQREYFDRELRDDEDVRAKGEYIANNPVRARIVARADDSPWLWRRWVNGTG